jgi:hypothetical protein
MDRSCRHCNGRRKSRAGRNSTTRHHIRNNEAPGRYTNGAVRGSLNAASHLSGRKVEGCCSVAVDSPAGNRSHARLAPAVCDQAQPPRRPTAATERQQLINTRGATSVHYRQRAAAGQSERRIRACGFPGKRRRMVQDRGCRGKQHWVSFFLLRPDLSDVQAVDPGDTADDAGYVRRARFFQYCTHGPSIRQDRSRHPGCDNSHQASSLPMVSGR